MKQFNMRFREGDTTSMLSGQMHIFLVFQCFLHAANFVSMTNFIGAFTFAFSDAISYAISYAFSYAFSYTLWWVGWSLNRVLIFA